jgi:nucleotide-binding universal stress UspA family protein
MKRILIATDGSAPAQEAVGFGLELARQQDAAVVFAHVIPRHELTEADREPLQRAVAAAESSGVRATTELLVGDPADEIVAYADSIDADAIVVGCRGNGRIVSAVLGSVSQGVLREARRPVVVVPRTRGARVTQS